MSSVRVIKFLSGQEIICKLVAEGSTQTGELTIIESPLTLQPMRSGDSTISIGLAPYTWAGSDKQIRLNPNHITTIMNAEENLETQYIAGLAGISMPNNPTAPSGGRGILVG